MHSTVLTIFHQILSSPQGNGSSVGYAVFELVPGSAQSVRKKAD